MLRVRGLDLGLACSAIRREPAPFHVRTHDKRNMPKSAPHAPAEKVAQYDKLVASIPRIERKGAGFPYTAVNGNMFSILRPDGVLCLRLSDEQRDAFVAKYKTPPVVMYGALMREYVAVPDSLFSNSTELKRYFKLSVTYAEGLRPKATKRTPAKKNKS